MFCALLTSRYHVSVYRTNGPLVLTSRTTKAANMPYVLGEHQFIILENFETIYISTNRTVRFMSQSFIAGSAIMCHFMPNDRSLWGSSLIPSIPPQKRLCRLKTGLLHTSQSSYDLFSY